MNNNNGTGIFGLDDNLGGGMNEGWWRIVDGKNSQRYYQMFFECMRKEVVIGGGGIKEGECILGRRGLFIGYREMRRVFGGSRLATAYPFPLYFPLQLG